jgi:hypothetical protein
MVLKLTFKTLRGYKKKRAPNETLHLEKAFFFTMKKFEHSFLIIFELVVVVTDADDEEKYVEGLQVGNF